MSKSAHPIDFTISPNGSLKGEIHLPGDKSISHRSLMFAALAEGETNIAGFLPGEDTLATAAALVELGVEVEQHSKTELTVKGVGLHGLKNPSKAIDLGNSGTSTRLLAGILAGAGVECEIVGDASLMTRPMNRVVKPLQQMGANISAEDDGTLPLKIGKANSLTALDYQCPVASAQLKSCLLLAGLYAEGTTVIHEPAVSRDHTERMLKAFGVEVEQNALTVSLKGNQTLKSTDINVPSDISSAAFFMVGALIAKDSHIILKQVGVNPTRAAVIDILKMMGGDIAITNEQFVGGEPVADIEVKSSQLKGIEIPEKFVPIAIDEFPAILVAAAVAEGETILTGAKELRVKESDRIKAMADGLRAIGIQLEEYDDGMVVEGGIIKGGTVDSLTDHRIAMSFSMAGLVSEQPIHILDCNNVATSFPNFVELATQAGLSLSVVERG